MIGSLIEKPNDGFAYVRYADDLLFTVLKGAESERISQSFQQMFQESLVELKLESTSFSTGQQTSLLVC